MVHFYEPFLAEYDPKERERRGVYYTPESVVSYIVRSLHYILKETFGRSDGFASTAVRVLDPAAGTCTFPAEAARQAVTEFTEKYGTGAKGSLVPDHILKNFYSFELMMAPYAVGHLKIGYLLEELGHKLEEDERFQLYLTNTLDMQELQETKLPGMSSLAEESHLAGKVKKETPILVILGNPPYSGHSANIGEWISQVIKDYYKVDGKPLGEKNPKWLQDDYVKFIRFAQWKIEQAGEGVLGFITNHSYLDNPTFRGMRQSLMQTFEQIHLLDLHGNSLKKERCPDGSKDENVFDIRQGVAIGLFVKKAGLERKVCHAELWGLREKKYGWLEENYISATKWTEIYPKSPFYLFVPRDEALLDRYQKYPKVTEIFPVHSLGFQTHRDEFVIDFDGGVLERRIRTFQDPSLPDELVRQTFGLKDNRDWKMSEKRKKIQEDEEWNDKIKTCLYRPFDTRWIFYHGDAIDFGRQDIMRHMIAGDNSCLLIPRQIGTREWAHVFISQHIAESCVVSNKTREQNYDFPLYLYPQVDKKDLFSKIGKLSKKAVNLNPSLLEALKKANEGPPRPEDILHYIYAVLYTPNYRTKYAEFLKTDFPRVPFTKNRELFVKLGRLGKQLVDLHLLKSSELDKPICRFQGKGDNRVEKQAYNQKEKRVYINKTQYFEGVEQEVWECQIGGYQVLDKWLKDRKKRILNLDDIKHYCRVVTALARTVQIQAEIDVLYADAERETLPFSVIQGYET
ncbi:MAG: type ISP restriction/modification enzyme [Candidatus Binatia bacterium]